MKNKAQYMKVICLADSEPSVRVEFIRRTYAHLAGAVLIFISLEYILLNSPLAEPLVGTMLGEMWSWAIVVGLYIAISCTAHWWASKETGPALQYLGLGLYIVAEAVIFLPILFIANYYQEGVIVEAGFMTLALFGGLTATVFVTRKDFSFMKPILVMGGFVALGVILASIAFGFDLGTFFVVIMILFASASILYDTSKILHHFKPTQHVAASLSLFASLGLLLWYVLCLLAELED